MNQNRSRYILFPLMLPILFFLGADLRADIPGDKGPGLAGLYRTDRAKLVADLVIDVVALPEEAQIKVIGNVETDRTGNLFVVDMLSCDIKKFDRKGKLIKVIGRKGQGPGEFQMPYLIAAGRDSFLVFDVMTQKLNRLDLDGNFIRGLSVPFPGETPKRLMSLPGGGFILETEKTITTCPTNRRTYASSRSARTLNRGTSFGKGASCGPDIGESRMDR